MKKAIKTVYYNQIEKLYYSLTYILINVCSKTRLMYCLFAILNYGILKYIPKIKLRA